MIAVIPLGFCVVKDSNDDPTDVNNIDRGLVISDKANDDLDNKLGADTTENQFVWIPVEDQ